MVERAIPLSELTPQRSELIRGLTSAVPYNETKVDEVIEHAVDEVEALVRRLPKDKQEVLMRALTVRIREIRRKEREAKEVETDLEEPEIVAE